VTSPCKYDNEPRVLIQGEDFLEWLFAPQGILLSMEPFQNCVLSCKCILPKTDPWVTYSYKWGDKPVA